MFAVRSGALPVRDRDLIRSLYGFALCNGEELWPGEPCGSCFRCWSSAEIVELMPIVGSGRGRADVSGGWQKAGWLGNRPNVNPRQYLH